MSLFTSDRDAGSAILFADRQEAGEKLAQVVLDERTQELLQAETPFVVYALPRGGLPIAAPVARLLQCPLDIMVAKKITRPDNSELAIGAVTAEGHVVWAFQRRSADQNAALHATALQEAQTHAQSQLRQLDPEGKHCSPTRKIALVVDDGIATGMTMSAAVQALRSQQAAQVWICTPVAPRELMPFLEGLSDRVIVLATPSPFYSVSRFYREFPQVSTEEAASYLHPEAKQAP